MSWLHNLRCCWRCSAKLARPMDSNRYRPVSAWDHEGHKSLEPETCGSALCGWWRTRERIGVPERANQRGACSARKDDDLPLLREIIVRKGRAVVRAATLADDHGQGG